MLEGRIAIVPDVLKPYVKDGKINVEDFGKQREGETDEVFKSRIWAYIKLDYCTKDFFPRQALHYKFVKEYIDGKSYYDKFLNIDEVRKAIYKGEIIFTQKGDWNKKILNVPILGGVLVSGSLTQSTNRAIVHISNKGIHVVPSKERR